MNTYLKLTFCFLLLVSASTAQTVEVIDKKGTIKTIRNNRVSVTVTEPITPIEGDIWIDSTSSITKIYDGANWHVINEPDASSSVYTGSFKIEAPSGASSTTISKAIKGLPFLPSQITFVAHTNIEDLQENDGNSHPSNANTINNTSGSMTGFARTNEVSGFVQHVIFIGGHGNSITNITRYSSDSNCIGLRYTNNRGQNLGILSAALTSFDTHAASDYGFTLSVKYSIGTEGRSPDENAGILSEDVMVFFTAYK